MNVKTAPSMILSGFFLFLSSLCSFVIVFFFFIHFQVNGHNVHQLRWARLVFIIYNAIIVCIVSSDMLQTISFRCVKVKNSDENCKHMSECDYNFRGVSVCVCVCFMNDVCSFYSLCFDNYLKYEKYMHSFKRFSG